MATKTLTGSYPSGYALSAAYQTLDIASTAFVGGAGITAATTFPVRTVNNLGKVQGTGNGIALPSGGTIVNGSAMNTTALIEGTHPIVLNGDPGSVTNYAKIVSDRYTGSGGNDYRESGIKLNFGGSVINAASGTISNGVVISTGSGNNSVTNDGTIGGSVTYEQISGATRVTVGYAVTINGSGQVTNGSNGNTNASTGAIRLGSGTVANNGTVSGWYVGSPSSGYVNSIRILSGGGVTNGSSTNTAAVIKHGIEIGTSSQGTGTVTNFGKIGSAGDNIESVYPVAYGVSLVHGGSVTNGSASDTTAAITGYRYGVYDALTGSVVNFGTITGHSDNPADGTRYGVKIKGTTLSGTDLTNGSEADKTALISGDTVGVYLGTKVSANNFGTIQNTNSTTIGRAPTAVYLRNASITNGSATDTAAQILGTTGVAGYGTIVNFGTIRGLGGVAVNLLASTLNHLVEEGTGVLDGTVNGNTGTLSLAGDAGAGTLVGLGSTISGFKTVDVVAGANWTLSGSSAVAANTVLSNHGSLAITGAVTNSGTIDLFANVVNSGSIANQTGSKLLLEGDVSITTDPAVKSGAFSNAGTVQKVSGTGTSIIRTGTASFSSSGTISVASGILELTGSTVGITGKVTGAGTIEFSVGATTLGAGTAISTAGLMLAGTGTSVTVAHNLGFAGSFSAGANTELAIGAGALFQLTGPSSFTRDTVDGVGRLATKGTTTASQVTLGGTAQWYNAGTLSLTGGALTVGDSAGNKAVFVNQATGVFDLAGNFNIGIGTGASTFTNQGLLAKTVGSLSTIGIAVSNSGTIEAASGALDLQKAVTGTGILKIDAGKVLQADAAVAATQTVDFNGGNDRLVLTDATHFAGKLQDFGSGDRLDLRQFNPSTTTLAFSEKADNSGGTLTMTDGTLVAKISLLGQYAASGFHTASDGVGGTYVTYMPHAASALASPHA